MDDVDLSTQPEAGSEAGTAAGSGLPSPAPRPTPTHRPRVIGRWGTVARAVIGVALVVDVLAGHATGGWHPMPWLLALVVFPAVLLTGQLLRSRFDATRLDATGPVWHVASIVVFLALYLTPVYAPALEATSDAALVFYGASMLLAAARGYAGCEVLAVSNSLLRRDDQVGCLLFAPIDHLEDR